jgi:hypothetical protein
MTGSLKSRTSLQNLLGGAKKLVEEGWDEGGVMLRRRSSSSKDLGVRDPALGARRDPALGARERKGFGGGGGAGGGVPRHVPPSGTIVLL